MEKSDIEKTIDALKQNLDNPEWLSKAVVFLAGQLYYHNELMSIAELEEKQATVKWLNQVDSKGKKTSVAESDKRGVVETENKYGKLKAQSEALVELINSIKHRLKVLEWERGSTGGQA